MTDPVTDPVNDHPSEPWEGYLTARATDVMRILGRETDRTLVEDALTFETSRGDAARRIIISGARARLQQLDWNAEPAPKLPRNR